MRRTSDSPGSGPLKTGALRLRVRVGIVETFCAEATTLAFLAGFAGFAAAARRTWLGAFFFLAVLAGLAAGRDVFRGLAAGRTFFFELGRFLIPGAGSGCVWTNKGRAL